MPIQVTPKNPRYFGGGYNHNKTENTTIPKYEKGESKYYLNSDDEKKVMNAINNIQELLLKDKTGSLYRWDKAYGDYNSNGTGDLDPRVTRYLLSGSYGLGFPYQSNDIRRFMNTVREVTNDFIAYYKRTFKEFHEVEDENNNDTNKGSGDKDDSDKDDGKTSPSTTPGGTGGFAIPIEAFAGLTGIEKQRLIDYLHSLGFTDEEINLLKEGKLTVNQYTLERLTAEFEHLKENYPTFYNKLVKIIGFDIYNEDGTVNQGRLALLIAMAGKGLGMDIDLTPGSPFRNLLDDYVVRLQAAYQNDPSIRQRFIDKYGIDPFNSDGTIDLEKLALIKMLDGLKPDEYNLDDMIPNTVPTTEPLIDPRPVPTTPIDDIPVLDPTPIDTTPISNNPTNPDEPGGIAIGGISHGGGAVGGENQGVEGSSHGAIVDSEGRPLASAAASAAEGLSISGITGKDKNALASSKDSLTLKGNSIIGAIRAGTKGITDKVMKPTAIKLTSTPAKITTSKASVGVIAAASAAGVGAATSGGYLLTKQLHYIKFTPDNWNALKDELKGVIESLMLEVGFTLEELDTFKKSCFKIRFEELRQHTKRIEKIVKNSIALEEEMLAHYNFSIVDEEGKVDNYLTFITMLIDGKNSIDAYNMYNIINQYLEDPDDSDFEYMGIDMDDYICEEDDIDNITEINNPSIEKLGDDLTLEEATSVVIGDNNNIGKHNEESGFGREAISSGFELADDNEIKLQDGSSEAQEWLKDLGIE